MNLTEALSTGRPTLGSRTTSEQPDAHVSTGSRARAANTPFSIAQAEDLTSEDAAQTVTTETAESITDGRTLPQSRDITGARAVSIEAPRAFPLAGDGDTASNKATLASTPEAKTLVPEETARRLAPDHLVGNTRTREHQAMGPSLTAPGRDRSPAVPTEANPAPQSLAADELRNPSDQKRPAPVKPPTRQAAVLSPAIIANGADTPETDPGSRGALSPADGRIRHNTFAAAQQPPAALHATDTQNRLRASRPALAPALPEPSRPALTLDQTQLVRSYERRAEKAPLQPLQPDASLPIPDAKARALPLPDAAALPPTSAAPTRTAALVANTQSAVLREVKAPLTLEAGYASSAAIIGSLHAQASATPSSIAAPFATPLASPTALIQQIAAPIATTQPSTTATTIEIQLDPPELGRLEITLEFGEQSLRAVLSSERALTGELLRRHAELLLTELQDRGHAEVQLEFGSAGEQRDQPAQPALAGASVEEAENRPGEGSAVYVTAWQASPDHLDLKL